MKNIKMFHLNDCGYCDKARKAMKELKQEDKYRIKLSRQKHKNDTTRRNAKLL